MVRLTDPSTDEDGSTDGVFEEVNFEEGALRFSLVNIPSSLSCLN